MSPLFGSPPGGKRGAALAGAALDAPDSLRGVQRPGTHDTSSRPRRSPHHTRPTNTPPTPPLAAAASAAPSSCGRGYRPPKTACDICAAPLYPWMEAWPMPVKSYLDATCSQARGAARGGGWGRRRRRREAGFGCGEERQAEVASRGGEGSAEPAGRGGLPPACPSGPPWRGPGGRGVGSEAWDKGGEGGRLWPDSPSCPTLARLHSTDLAADSTRRGRRGDRREDQERREGRKAEGRGPGRSTGGRRAPPPSTPPPSGRPETRRRAPRRCTRS